MAEVNWTAEALLGASPKHTSRSDDPNSPRHRTYSPSALRNSPAKPKRTVRRVGMLGCGTVGAAVLAQLNDRRELFELHNVKLEVVKICVRDINKPRPGIPEDCVLTTDYHEVTTDPSIDLLIEVMGGVTDAKDAVFEAICHKKDIVTANKALLAEFLPQLLALLEEHSCTMGYEAAVCGGIPIIHTLQDGFLGDQVQMMKGIMNGTTNYMLSKMEAEGVDYADVLAEAQALGFAEADPTADVEGHDVRAKIALLAKLGFGVYVEPDQVPTKGISSITKVDFHYSQQLKSTIKLLGMARANPDGELTIMVTPALVKVSDPVASIAGPTNIVHIQSQNLGDSYLVGPGAGGAATANSIVSDVVQACKGGVSVPFPKTVEMPIASDYSASFYVRFVVDDCVGIIHEISSACVTTGISIDSIVQLPLEPGGWVRSACPFVLLTEHCKYSQVNALVDAVKSNAWAVSDPFVMPCL